MNNIQTSAIPLFYDEVIKILPALKTEQEIEFILSMTAQKMNHRAAELRGIKPAPSAKHPGENCSFAGMCLFTLLNYAAQRLVVFKQGEKDEKTNYV